MFQYCRDHAMPYKALEGLPERVRIVLPRHAREL
jgi:cation transport regulator ChaB